MRSLYLSVYLTFRAYYANKRPGRTDLVGSTFLAIQFLLTLDVMAAIFLADCLLPLAHSTTGRLLSSKPALCVVTVILLGVHYIYARAIRAFDVPPGDVPAHPSAARTFIGSSIVFVVLAFVAGAGAVTA